MHANPVPFQNLSALCTILITAIQHLNHWLCHPFICFLQASGHTAATSTNSRVSNVLSGLHALQGKLVLHVQFQGACYCLVLALGWVWAGYMRLREVKRLQAVKLQSVSRQHAARHGASAHPASSPYQSRQSSPTPASKVICALLQPLKF